MSTPSGDVILETLNDHYKDSFAYLQYHLKIRDKLFFLIILIIIVMLYQIYSPEASGVAIAGFIANRMNLEQSSVDISFFSSVIWFGLLAFILRYFQTVIHIERQYVYIHNLEGQLSSFYKDNVFTREGESYSNNYPLFSNASWIFYTIVFPILLIIVTCKKIYTEFSRV